MTNKMKVLLYCYIHSLLIFYPILLTVQGKTTVKPLKYVKAEIGQTVTLYCSVNREDGTFSVKWTANCRNNSLGQGTNESRVTLGKDKLEVTIANLTEEDSGIYRCQIDYRKKQTVEETKLQVIEKPAQQGTYGDQHTKVIILGSIAGFELCVIIVLLATLIKYCHPGTHATKDKVNEEEKTEDHQSLHYAEIVTKKDTRHTRIRHTEDVITYAAIKTQ